MTDTEIKEAKEKKEKKFVLPKEARYMMVSYLEEAGFKNVVEMDDETLWDQYNHAVISTDKKLKEMSVSKEQKNLNRYATENPNMLLKDKDFISRLFQMNVPSYYLHIFKDDDAALNDRAIWQKVNKSMINPINEISKLTKMHRSTSQRIIYR